MKVRFDRIGYPLYCDAGRYEGDMRIDLQIRLYLSPEEYARYEGSESLQITLSESAGGNLPERQHRRTLRRRVHAAQRGGRPVTEPVDYTVYALYREAMDAFGDPVFARWICRGYPWGGVDLNRAREGFLLACDGVTMTGGDARITLEHRIGHERQAAVLGPTARALRRLMIDVRRLASAHTADAEFPAAVPLHGWRRRVLRGARRPVGRVHAAQLGEADCRRPERVGRP